MAGGCGTFICGMAGIWGRPPGGIGGIASGLPDVASGAFCADIIRVYSLGSYGAAVPGGGMAPGIANACVAPPPPGRGAGAGGACGGTACGRTAENGEAEGNWGPGPTPGGVWKNFENSLPAGASRSGAGCAGGTGD